MPFIASRNIDENDYDDLLRLVEEENKILNNTVHIMGFNITTEGRWHCICSHEIYKISQSSIGGGGGSVVWW